MKLRFLKIGVIAICALCLLAAEQKLKSTPPFRKWERLSQRPVLAPRGDGFESAGVFNPAVVKEGSQFVMLYRAQDKNGTSRLGYATSRDGLHFSPRPEPVFVPETDYEKDGGVEDPRLVKLGDLYYLTYTGYNKQDAQLCLATSRDLIHWQRKGVLLPAYRGKWNVGWTKSGAIVTEEIGGKYWMYYLGTARDKTDQMGIAYSTDLVHWDRRPRQSCIAATCRALRFARSGTRPSTDSDRGRNPSHLQRRGRPPRLYHRLGAVR